MRRWAETRNCILSATRCYHDEPYPEENFDWLVILGGPMNVYEDKLYPWLTQEKRCIERALKKQKVVIGICLGAQLIAEVLGARVFRNQSQEIGWFPITLTEQARGSKTFGSLPHRMPVLHWHGDTFDLPAGAERIASSEACENQAFVVSEKIIGLQFHLEWTAEVLAGVIRNCGDELVAGRYIQSAEEMLGQRGGFKLTNEILEEVLERTLTGGI